MLGYAGPDEPEYARVASGLWLLRSTVEVEDLAAAATAPLPPLPVGPSLALHWLAVDGVQPQIAENPSPGASAAAAATLEQAASGAPPPVTIEALTRREGTTGASPRAAPVRCRPCADLAPCAPQCNRRWHTRCRVSCACITSAS